MKNKTISSQELASRFHLWQKNRQKAGRKVARRFLQIGACLMPSLSAVKADDKGMAPFVHQTATERSTDDSIIDEEIAGMVSRFADSEETDGSENRSLASHLLSPRERLQLAREYARPVKVAAPVVADPDSDPLPVDFVPVLVPDMEPIIPHDPEIEEQARIEAAKEIAWLETCAMAVSFDSQPFEGHPVDYSPRVPSMRELFPASKPAPVSADDELRLAVLALSL